MIEKEVMDMEKEKVRAAAIVASLLAVIGLVLMFCSVTFGTYLGEAWLFSQGGMADTSDYTMATKTYIHSFLITGSIFLAAGILTGLVTYMAVLVYGMKEEALVADARDEESEL